MRVSPTQIKALAALALAAGGHIWRSKRRYSYPVLVCTGSVHLAKENGDTDGLRFMFSKATANALADRGLADIVKVHQYREYNHTSGHTTYASEMECTITPKGFEVLLSLGREKLAQFDGLAFCWG